MAIKLRTIIFGVIGLIIMALGTYNILQNSKSWLSALTFIGGIIILIALSFEPSDDKLESNFEE